MSEIVIRHAETRDYEAIRQIHAQPEVYCNTLQVPHPSDHMWQERLADRPGIKQLVACIDGDVVGHLTIDVQQRPRRSHVADFGICVDSRWKNRGVASALMREMIEMCDNWLRVDRISRSSLLYMDALARAGISVSKHENFSKLEMRPRA